MTIITIFYDREGKCRQVIKAPGEMKGKGRSGIGCAVGDIVDTITNSDRDFGHKNYSHFTVS